MGASATAPTTTFAAIGAARKRPVTAANPYAYSNEAATAAPTARGSARAGAPSRPLARLPRPVQKSSEPSPTARA